VHAIAKLDERLTLLQARTLEATVALVEETLEGFASARVPLWHVVDETRPVMYGIILPGEHVPGGVPVIKGGDVEASRLRPELLSRTSPEIDAAHARSRIQPGDVLVTIRGSFGAAAEVPQELAGANLTQDTARLAPSELVLSRWLLHALRAPSTRAQLERVVTGASVKGVNIRDLKRIRIPLASLREQQRALEELEPRLRRLDDLSDRVRRMRIGLVEYRDSLITEAVVPNYDMAKRRGMATSAELRSVEFLSSLGV
jgi:type I restriction enzyme S subunit